MTKKILTATNPNFKGVGTEADSVIGSTIADSIFGGSGKDTLIGNAGNDTIDGGNDDDILSGGDDDDALRGGNGNDLLNGDDGDDNLNGGKGNDTLDGGDGADTLEGGAGNDYYFVDNAGDTIIEATTSSGGKKDTVEISIPLVWKNNFSIFTGVENYLLTGDSDFDAAGDNNANAITGNIGNNYLFGNAGNDTLIGNEGDDTLEGGKGRDVLNGGAGDDVYIINNVEDTIIDNEGVDVIQSSETITIVNYKNVENLQLTGIKNINGTGNDNDNLIDGNDADNKIDGGKGDDILNSGDGADTLIGGEGNNTLNGGDGNSDVAIYKGISFDYVIKQIDDVWEVTNIQTDAIDQLTDIEFVKFNDKQTVLSELLTNNESEEPTIEQSTPDPVEPNPEPVKPTPEPVTSTTPTPSEDKFEIEATKPPADMIFDWDFSQTEGDDTLDISNLPNAKNVRIMALSGNDTIQGGSAVRWIDGGDGNDAIFGSDGITDTLLGGAGNDLLSAGGHYIYAPKSLYVANGDNDYTSSNYPPSKDGNSYYGRDENAKNVLSGGLGNDTLWGGNGDDMLIGGDGDDSIVARGWKNEKSSDTIIGGFGNDTIQTGAGNDTLSGDAGIDLIVGGEDSDLFIFAKGDSGIGTGNRDIILDFEPLNTGEVIDLSLISNGKLTYEGMKPFSAINQVRYEMDFVNTTTIVKLNLDNDPKTTEMEIELTGFKNLTADDFVLVKT